MSVTETAPQPRNVALEREVGLIGLTWASKGSIIGSGWLFAPQEALEVAGLAVLISWVIGGIAIILALVHAELHGMHPVSGGTAGFPHHAFGGVAGASFGWFAWLNAATVAPIEVPTHCRPSGPGRPPQRSPWWPLRRTTRYDALSAWWRSRPTRRGRRAPRPR